MTDFTRLTVIGTTRRAELVVPDDETLGALLPRLMDLLDEPAGAVARPLTLVRATGEQVESGLTAAEQQLSDGEQLRLVRADEAPPPPEVADVTDVVGDTFADRRGRWSSTARHAVGAVTIGAGCALAAFTRSVPASTGVVLIVVLLVAAVALGRLGTGSPNGLNVPNVPSKTSGPRRWPVLACTAAAAGLALPVARQLTTGFGAAGVALVWPTVALGLVWVVLGVGIGLGLGHRSAGPAAVLGVALVALPLALGRAGIAGDRPVVLTAVAAVVVLGLLPWYALSSSGLTGLDDQVLAGTPSRRPDAVRTVAEAYRSLSWSAVAVAVPLAGTAALLVGSSDRWAMVLGLVVVTVTALRTRAFPLVVQQVPLCLAAAVGAVAAVLRHRPAFDPPMAAALLIGLVVVVAVAAGVRPAAHHRARLRRLGNLVEALAVIALAPLALGAFGVFGDLIGAFR